MIILFKIFDGNLFKKYYIEWIFRMISDGTFLSLTEFLIRPWLV